MRAFKWPLSLTKCLSFRLLRHNEPIRRWWSVARSRAWPNSCPQDAAAFLSFQLGTSGNFTESVCSQHSATVNRETLFFSGGEENKRLVHIEQLAEQMVERGADRSSMVVAIGGGIVTDMAGFLSSIFMRGIPLIQIPTTLLAQVDAAVGGKTGVNLVAGKNLIGCFHQPLAVLVDPSVLGSLPPREYRAGLYEIIKSGVIMSEPLFRILAERRDEVLAQSPQSGGSHHRRIRAHQRRRSCRPMNGSPDCAESSISATHSGMRSRRRQNTRAFSTARLCRGECAPRLISPGRWK